MMEQDRDYELLSAYLDGALEEDARAALEARLESDAALRRELAALRQTVALVRSLPTLKAPRNFTLTAAQAEQIRPQYASTTFAEDGARPDDAAVPDNILTLPTTRQVMPRRASRQPFWVGAAAAVVLGMICVATLLLTMSASLPQMSVSNFQGDQSTGISAMSTPTESGTLEELQESQTAAEEAAGSAADTTTESAEGDDGGGNDDANAGANGRDDRPSGTGGAAAPAEPSTTLKLNETPVTVPGVLIATDAPTASPMGTLDVQRAVSQAEIQSTQPADTFAYDPTAGAFLTLTAEDLTLRSRVATGAALPASPMPMPAPSATFAGYDATAAAFPTNEALIEGTLVDTLNQNTPSDVMDEATSDAENTDTDAASEVAPLTMMTATETVPNMQQIVPPTLGEAEADTMGMLAEQPAVSFSITELLLWTLFQIIVGLF